MKEKALEYFDKALHQAQKAQEYVYEMNVLLNMALLLEVNNELDKAIDCLENALRIDPENN